MAEGVMIDDLGLVAEEVPADEARSTTESFYCVSQVRVHFSTRDFLTQKHVLCGHAHFDRVPDHGDLRAAANSIEKLRGQAFTLYWNDRQLSDDNTRSLLSGLTEDPAGNPERTDIFVTVVFDWRWVWWVCIVLLVAALVCLNIYQCSTIQTLKLQLKEKEHTAPNLKQQVRALQLVLDERSAGLSNCQDALAESQKMRDACVTSEPAFVTSRSKATAVECKEELAGAKGRLEERGARIEDLKAMLPMLQQRHDAAQDPGAPRPQHAVPAEQCQAGEHAAALAECQHRIKQLKGLLSSGHKAPPTVDATSKDTLLPRTKVLQGTVLEEDGGYIIKTEWARGADLGTVHFSAEVSVTVFSEHTSVFSFRCSDGFKKVCEALRMLSISKV